MLLSRRVGSMASKHICKNGKIMIGGYPQRELLEAKVKYDSQIVSDGFRVVCIRVVCIN